MPRLKRSHLDQRSSADSAGVTSAQSGVDDGAPRSVDQVPSAGETPRLQSLASRYDEKQHATYLRHLEEAIGDPRNLNIALTGRYGTGKSSVLDEFEARHRSKVLRVGIASLGVESKAETITNRIQKELVKQILYRASPRQLRNSRFNRIVPLTTQRAALESATAVAVLGLLLFFLQWLPTVAGTSSHHHLVVRAASWLAVGLLAVAVVTVLRLAIYARFFISDVSAAGAAVKLSPRTISYFDQYLDELVYFFDEVGHETVIFEDLDRFDDPHIFEALRELNSILNSTPKRLKKQKPLRFVYAIKDSLFERLGSDTEQSTQDAVAAETVRANRTKFFDVVIPVVPFISHRNARELLSTLLSDLGGPEIDRRLVALVGRHITDMRLLRNICNEFLVFAERLLSADTPAPGLTASNLFALVVYKNFHLEDFEQIPRRCSALDRLYEQRRELVRAAVDACERRRRELMDQRARSTAMAQVAKDLGQRLELITDSARAAASPRLGRQEPFFLVASERFTTDQLDSYEFWKAVADAGEVSVGVAPPGYAEQMLLTFGTATLEGLFRQSLDAGRWQEVDEEQVREALATLAEDIAFLRGADFRELVRASRFKLTLDEVEYSFADIVTETMGSELARDLVKEGYLDRNFALYAAQFYGHFTGVDVATFLVQSVQTNTMDLDYTFDSPEAVRNLLDEAPADFTRTAAALNVDVVDYLLSARDERARDIATLITSESQDEGIQFLGAYLNSGTERRRLTALLSSSGWPRVFTFLVANDQVPSETRSDLVDAALLAVRDVRYELSTEVREFIVEHYKGMSAFTEAHDEQTVGSVVALIRQAGVVLPDLDGLDDAVRRPIVREHLYLVTPENIRHALGGRGDISLDRALADADVYEYCLRSPGPYLAAVESDRDTECAILSEESLIRVLTDVADRWEQQELQRLVANSSPESSLAHLTGVPASTWKILAAARRFRPTLDNVQAYADEMGSIDSELGQLLADAGSIEVTEATDEAKLEVATKVLNAAEAIGSATLRVQLAESLGLEDPLSPSDLPVEQGDLFALMIEAGLAADTAESFLHFREAGWQTMEAAIVKSQQFAAFMTPELIEGLVPDVFASRTIPEEIRARVMADLDTFVEDDDKSGLEAVATYALSHDRTLPEAQIRRIAVGTQNPGVTVPLLASAVTALSPDDMISVLAVLGDPYNFLSSRAKTQFEVPADDAHRVVLDTLKKAGLLSEFRKRRLKDVCAVKLT